MPTTRAVARLTILAAALSMFIGLTASARAQNCANRLSQDLQHHPTYSSTLPNLLSTAGNDAYIYEATEWGYVRASLSNPASPGPLKLIQVGQKTVLGGTNGGLVYQFCDCNQGANAFAAADAPDGSSRMLSDWVAPSSNMVPGVVVRTLGGGDPTMGNQINIQPVGLSSQVAAAYMPGSGKFFGYFPATKLGTGNGPVQIVDVTSLSGSPDSSAAISPIGSLNWNGVFSLKSGVVSIGGLSKTLLVGYVTSDATVRVAEIDNFGTPTQKASISAPYGTFSVAMVNSRAYVFIAAGASGLNAYEYTGSALNFAGNIPGYFDTVVVKGAPGSPYPAIFVHRASPTDTLEIWDTKWLTSGTPVKAFSVPHQGSPAPSGRGNAIEAVVTGTGSSIIAHMYSLANTNDANPEHLLVTDNVDISCIAADTTSPPTANAITTNVSAGLRADKNNYYGDKFTLTDSSSSGVAISNTYWDINQSGTTASVDITTSAPTLAVTGYLPCEPTNAGNFATGVGCGASLGLGPAPAGQSFHFAEQSRNQNGLSVNPPGPPAGWFVSPPIAFAMPQIGIAGFTAGTLRVLSGGTIDASTTQGNTSEATFVWAFTGGSVPTASGITTPVPTGATAFSLTVTWPGGYAQTASGAIIQTDIVPAFTMSPNPVGLGTSFTLTNTMQKSASTILGSVDASVLSGTCPGSPNFTSTLAASFLTAGGTASMNAPATVGPYCVTLRYNYTPALGNPTNQVVSNPLTVVNAQMNANVTGPSTGTVGNALTFTANVSGGTPPYTYFWDCNYAAFLGQGNFTTPGAATQQCTFNANGTYTPGVRVHDSGSVVSTVYANVSISGGSGGGTISASVSGPSTGSTNTPITFTAVATGGSGVYSYAWACDFSFVGGTGQFISGGISNVCTYPTNGARTVAVNVTDTGSKSGIGQTAISIGGGTPGGLGVNVTGPSTGAANAVLTYTATATAGTAPYQYAWACDYSQFGGTGQFTAGTSTKTCTFTSNGVHTVAVRATDAVSASIINSTNTTISGPGLPSVQFTTTGPGAISSSGSTYTVGLNQPVTFSSSEANATSWAWAFGDTTVAVGATAKSVTKTYTAKGTLAAALAVTGNGNQTAGTNTANFTVQVVTPPPSGVFTIAGAQSNADGTVFTANVGDQLTMTAAEPNALSWGWIFGDGTTGASPGPHSPVTKTYSTLGSYTVKLLVTGDETNTTGLTISTFTINVVSCVSSGTTLCLNDNRFRATVNWAVPDQGKTGAGNGVALTGDTGYYWFFSPTNIELVLKVVDGRSFNGNYWVFYGALSDVQYDISIQDTTTGVVKTYHNPYHTTASVADVNAFPGGSAPSSKKPEAVSSISVSCVPSPATVGQQVTCTASPSGTYGWTWGDETAFPAPYAPGPNPNSHTYTKPGTVRVTATTDGGATIGFASLAVTGSAPGGLAATIAGPSSGTTGTSVTFTGAATGGTGPYVYAWACDYTAASPNFITGTATNSCSYTTTGAHTVGLKVTDSAATPGTFITTANITISAPAGPGLPSNAFTLDGATLNTTSGKYETEIGRTVTFTSSEQYSSKVGWAFGDGGLGEGNPTTHVFQQPGSFTGTMLVYGDDVHTTGLNIASIPLTVLPCAGDAKTLCLNGGRFKVSVTWSSPTSSGVGTAVPVTPDTGEFWFLSSNNVELVLKVVDGTSFNGHFWVFYGALSNLQYTITVLDTTTGTVKTYENPQGTTASVADINAF